MTTLAASELEFSTRTYSGVTWHEVQTRGWSTGLCDTPQAAVQRAVAWFAGESIDVAPTGQASVEEIQAAIAFFQRPENAVRGATLQILARALTEGLNTVAWLLGTVEVSRALRCGMLYPETYATMRRDA